jgi:arginase
MPDNTPSGGWDLIAVPSHLDEHIAGFPVPASTAATVGPPLPAGTRPARMTRLYQAAAAHVARATRPLLLSGDCTTALAAAAGLQHRHREFAVAWLDAHGDFNTPATTITGYLGGMPLAMLAGRAPELIAGRLGLRPVPENNILLVDARDLDPAERGLLAASRVRHIPAAPDATRDALAGLRHLPIYLHVDADIIDSAQLPGLRVPAGPGPSLTQIEECLTSITATANVMAACIACTWLPEHLNTRATREAITRLASAIGGQLTWQTGEQADTRNNP